MINFVNQGSDLSTLLHLRKSIECEELEKAIRNTANLHPEMVTVHGRTGDYQSVRLKSNQSAVHSGTKHSKREQRYVDAVLKNSGSMAKADHVIKGASKEAQAAYDHARSTEKKITADLARLSFRMGGRMHGTKFSVKTGESTADKIKRKLNDNPDLTDVDVVKGMGDLVRYTMLVDHDDIPSASSTAVKRLEENGYKVVKLENKYVETDENGKRVPTTRDYKGVHLDVINPDGQRFELQVHSKTSMDVKDKLHPMYEEWRKVDTPPDRKKELSDAMKALSKTVPMPKGIMDLHDVG